MKLLWHAQKVADVVFSQTTINISFEFVIKPNLKPITATPVEPTSAEYDFSSTKSSTK